LIHSNAYELLRLLVANHPFIDANKRTALNTVVVFYRLNGYAFNFDDGILDILRQFGIDESNVDREHVMTYLRERTEQLDIDQELRQYRPTLVRFGVDSPTTDSTDPNH